MASLALKKYGDDLMRVFLLVLSAVLSFSLTATSACTQEEVVVGWIEKVRIYPWRCPHESKAGYRCKRLFFERIQHQGTSHPVRP
jgi:hypothetical protein